MKVVDAWEMAENYHLVDNRDATQAVQRKALFNRGNFSAIAQDAKNQFTWNIMDRLKRNKHWCIAVCLKNRVDGMAYSEQFYVDDAGNHQRYYVVKVDKLWHHYKKV